MLYETDPWMTDEITILNEMSRCNSFGASKDLLGIVIVSMTDVECSRTEPMVKENVKLSGLRDPWIL